MDGGQHTLRRRAPSEVMRLARMGSFHPTRLSFMRVLLRRLEREGWRVTRPVWRIDPQGVGHAVYTAKGPERTYSLVAFAHDLPDHLRSDRVIAEAWDATFALFDGVPDEDDIERLARNVPKQEAGRMSGSELTLSRANRSVRLFAHVRDALAAGRQPDLDEIDRVGYLMRTTAVYGSAKFGLADREAVCARPELSEPFQAEMLTVWLIRAFSVNLVEHLAQADNPDAARLDDGVRQRLGVGNSTGLGMAPFLLTHPVLIHHWMVAREEALVRVRGISPNPGAVAHFRRALTHATQNAAVWRSDHSIQIARLEDLRTDLTKIAIWVEGEDSFDWDALWNWGCAHLTLEGQEVLLALMLEPHGDLVDDLTASMSADEEAATRIDGRQTVAQLRALLAEHYAWALSADWSDSAARARLWYVSAEKLEPRLAERADEDLDDYEQPLGPAFAVAAAAKDLESWALDQSVGAFLARHPEHRHAVRRVQVIASHDYGEVQDNTLAAEMMPIDLLRAKLSFFGATRFDPRSDRWVRISMFQGAPFPDQLGSERMDAWMYGG